jgi:tRNA-specific 2-thiouridylase
LYVTEIDTAKNRVVVGEKDALFRHVVRADEVNVLQPNLLETGQTLYGKIRSQGDADTCAVLEVSIDGIAVEFEEAVFAPAPDQRLVLYDSMRRVVAGGIITGSE